MIYFMGLLGSAVYLIQHALTFWGGVLGFIKSLFWPALLIYQLFEYLKV